MGLKYVVDSDAWSSGQLVSKIWLCEELEKIPFDSPQHIVLLGGWYGMIPHILTIRNTIPIKRIDSYDIDRTVKSISLMLNEMLVWKGKFFSHTEDCNTLVNYDADIIINTSSEHFDSNSWWVNIPDGKIVVIQNNDMTHDTHVNNVNDVEELIVKYPMTELIYSGTKTFDYDMWSFTRFMVIGKK